MSTKRGCGPVSGPRSQGMVSRAAFGVALVLGLSGAARAFVPDPAPEPKPELRTVTKPAATSPAKAPSASTPKAQSPAKAAPRGETGRAAAQPAEPVGRKPGERFRDCPECPELVVVGKGRFTMGSPESEQGRSTAEGPTHPVTIDRDFALGRYEVSVGEFRRFVEASGYRSEAERDPDKGIAVWDSASGRPVLSKGKSWRDPGFAQDDRHPVVGVSWNDARAYSDWLSQRTGARYRLPSEAEWEYAARASKVSKASARYWGDDADRACSYANVGDKTLKEALPDWPYPIHDCADGFARTAPVGQFRPNAFGLHDMIGNVWELTEDCWNDSYSGAPEDGSAWLEGNCARRVVRGGSWGSRPESARSAHRSWAGPDNRINSSGFRVARTL